MSIEDHLNNPQQKISDKNPAGTDTRNKHEQKDLDLEKRIRELLDQEISENTSIDYNTIEDVALILENFPNDDPHDVFTILKRLTDSNLTYKEFTEKKEPEEIETSSELQTTNPEKDNNEKKRIEDRLESAAAFIDDLKESAKSDREREVLDKARDCILDLSNNL